MSRPDPASKDAVRDDAPLFVDDVASAPRGVIRLLRSGLLSEERAQRVLRIHGATVEGWLRPRA